MSNKTTQQNEKKYVWYACYGSNLSYDRFMEYIKKSDDDTYPDRKVRIKEYRGNLYFGGYSKNRKWYDCGTAFYDKEGAGTVIMRLYRITKEQFDSVCEKENSSRRYPDVVSMGTYYGTEVFTITGHAEENAPGKAYLDIIANALKDELGLGEEKTREYLAQWMPAISF